MRVSRRQFLQSAGAVLALGGPGLPAAETPRAPFRLLYNNDLTNVAGCTSPWHARDTPFRPEMLEASVDEAAAADVQLLAPGLGEVPWWKSKVLPLEEHAAWFRARYGLGPDSMGRFVLEGGDPLQIFIDRCRARGIAPFLSFRLNDAHFKENVDARRGEKITGASFSGISQFYHDHPEWRVGPNVQSGSQHVMNWAIPEVRARKLAFLTELCEQYDLAGVELDFLRYFSYFQLDKTTAEQRRAVQVEFVRQVRSLLDRTARNGTHRWLSARISSHLSVHDPTGIDVARFAAAGVDIFNLSGYYPTQQQTDAPALRAAAPERAFFLELTHTTQAGANLSAVRKYDDATFRRTTEAQMTTTAHLAYDRGMQGISLFNFVYFREHGTPGRGPFCEPPLALLPRLKDPAWLARQPQDYFIARVTDEPRKTGRPFGDAKKPRFLEPGKTMTLDFDLAPVAGREGRKDRLRVQAEKPIGDRQLQARINGASLPVSADLAERYPVPTEALLGTAETLRAWEIPSALLRDGVNQVELTLETGAPIAFVFVDIALS